MNRYIRGVTNYRLRLHCVEAGSNGGFAKSVSRQVVSAYEWLIEETECVAYLGILTQLH